MRRPTTWILVAAVALFAGATVVLLQKYRQASADYVDMRDSEQTARSNYIEAFNAIAEIQDSLDAIRLRSGAVGLRSQRLQGEQKLTGASREEALESIALLNASIERTKGKIGDLENQLKKSGTRIVGLQKMLAGLKRTLGEREEQIAALSGRVDSLNTQVAGLQSIVQDDRVAMDEQRRELGTVYYIVGTKQALTKNGVVVAKGGVLGLGKTLKLTGKADEAMFTAMDTDQETTIHIPSVKVQVLSPQPTASYELTSEGSETVLRIVDPKEFRKVKHVVIMTA